MEHPSVKEKAYRSARSDWGTRLFFVKQKKKITGLKYCS